MKYMILLTATQADYDAMAGGTDGQGRSWSEADLQAMFEHMEGINQEMQARGELIDGQGLAGPEATRTVRVVDGKREVTDGPYGEAKEFLAGYWVVDCETEERALEIAARASASPGPGGTVSSDPVQVRPIMEAPGTEM
jgi:hypothetical protein